MQERQVTVEGEPRPLPDPFLVLATQNPIEYEGTYPLPEAQLDRFLFKLDVGYPDEADERRCCDSPHRGVAPATLDDVAAGRDAGRAARGARDVDATGVSDEVVAYVARSCGGRASCRASSSARARAPRCTCWRPRRRAARLAGRDFVTPDDVVARPRRPCCATGSCCGPRPSSSASRRTTRCTRDAAGRRRSRGEPRLRARPRCSRSCARRRDARSCRVWLVVLAAVAVVAAVVVDAFACGEPAGRARRAAGRRRAACRAARRRRRAPTRRACACASRVRRTCARAAGGGRRARRASSSRGGAAATSCPPRRRARPGRSGSARGPPAGRGGRGLVYPDLPAARRLALAVRRGRFRESGRARAARSGSAPSSSRSATTAPTTTCARSTGARPRGSAGRCRTSTASSATATSSACSTAGG